MRSRIISLLLVLSSAAALADGAASSPHEAIHQAVTHYIAENTQHLAGKETEITLGRLDPRLNLDVCPVSPDATPLGQFKGIGKNNFIIRCDQAAKPWKVYLSAEISVYDDVVVTTEPLARGAIISGAALTTVRRRLTEVHGGYYSDPAEVIGMKLKRSLAIGSLVQTGHVTAPTLVRRGESVTIKSGSSMIQVTSTGKSLMDGALGERVQVRNDRSARVVEGVVTAPGVIVVGNAADR
ncbi:MAG: flagellar basal body P-ring formation chaperone FlgA [Pseudomonadota bacterium]